MIASVDFKKGKIMYIAIDENNHRIDVVSATKERKYFCPVCRSEVIIKDGTINAKHFAHVANTCIDNWNYDMSEWHQRMQAYFSPEFREVVVRNGKKVHRADVLINNTVIEFQHSPISAEEFADRNAFFNDLGMRIAWVFDVSEQFEAESIVPFGNDNDFQMKWKYPMRIFAESPPISDYNKRYSLWFFFGDNKEDGDIIEKVIWTAKDDNENPSLRTFILSNYYILLNEIDVDELFFSKTDFFNQIECELRQTHKFRKKYCGEKGHNRDDYICPLHPERFGIKIYHSYSCSYCRYCYMISDKKRNGKHVFTSYCCYPQQVQELVGEDPEYEAGQVRMFDI